MGSIHVMHLPKSWSQWSLWVNSKYSGILYLEPKKKKKRSKKNQRKKLKICNRILYILCGHCVFLNTSYFRTKGTKRVKNYRQYPKRKGNPESIHTVNIPPEHSPVDPLADKSLPGNNVRFPFASVFQHSAWEGFGTYTFQFPDRRAEDMTLQAARVRIPSQCSDSRLGLQQAGVRMRNSGDSPWRNVRRIGEYPIQPRVLLAFTGKACRE